MEDFNFLYSFPHKLCLLCSVARFNAFIKSVLGLLLYLSAPIDRGVDDILHHTYHWSHSGSNILISSKVQECIYIYIYIFLDDNVRIPSLQSNI